MKLLGANYSLEWVPLELAWNFVVGELWKFMMAASTKSDRYTTYQLIHD